MDLYFFKNGLKYVTVGRDADSALFQFSMLADIRSVTSGHQAAMIDKRLLFCIWTICVRKQENVFSILNFCPFLGKRCTSGVVTGSCYSISGTGFFYAERKKEMQVAACNSWRRSDYQSGQCQSRHTSLHIHAAPIRSPTRSLCRLLFAVQKINYKEKKMNIAFSDITEECALELVHLVHSYCATSNHVSQTDANASLRTYPKDLQDDILMPFALKKSRGRSIPCDLVHSSGEIRHFASLRDALRFLGMNPTGMSRRFAESMVVNNWHFSFPK